MNYWLSFSSWLDILSSTNGCSCWFGLHLLSGILSKSASIPESNACQYQDSFEWSEGSRFRRYWRHCWEGRLLPMLEVEECVLFSSLAVIASISFVLFIRFSGRTATDHMALITKRMAITWDRLYLSEIPKNKTNKSEQYNWLPLSIVNV